MGWNVGPTTEHSVDASQGELIEPKVLSKVDEGTGGVSFFAGADLKLFETHSVFFGA